MSDQRKDCTSSSVRRVHLCCRKGELRSFFSTRESFESNKALRYASSVHDTPSVVTVEPGKFTFLIQNRDEPDIVCKGVEIVREEPQRKILTESADENLWKGDSVRGQHTFCGK